jgi:hypothetical protein
LEAVVGPAFDAVLGPAVVGPDLEAVVGPLFDAAAGAPLEAAAGAGFAAGLAGALAGAFGLSCAPTIPPASIRTIIALKTFIHPFLHDLRTASNKNGFH